jgi:hypothetical protein
MRSLSRSGPLVLVMGVAMLGCNQATESSKNPVAAPSRIQPTSAATSQSTASSADYVLGIDGMF